VCVRTTHEGYLVVFVAVQNLVGIDAVVLMHVFPFHEFGLKTPIHAPKMGFMGDLTPKWGLSHRDPKRH